MEQCQTKKEFWNITILERNNWNMSIWKKKHLGMDKSEKGTIGKWQWVHLKMNTSENRKQTIPFPTRKTERGQLWKRNICKGTILKANILNLSILKRELPTMTSEKGTSEKGHVCKMTILERKIGNIPILKRKPIWKRQTGKGQLWQGTIWKSTSLKRKICKKQTCSKGKTEKWQSKNKLWKWTISDSSYLMSLGGPSCEPNIRIRRRRNLKREKLKDGKGQIWKAIHLETPKTENDNSAKENMQGGSYETTLSEKEQFWKGNSRTNTLPKKKLKLTHIKTNTDKGQCWKGIILKMTITKRKNKKQTSLKRKALEKYKSENGTCVEGQFW